MQNLWGRGKLCRVEGKNKPVGIDRRMEQGPVRDRGTIRDRLWRLYKKQRNRDKLILNLSWFSEASLYIFMIIHSLLGMPEWVFVLCNPKNLSAMTGLLQQWDVCWVSGATQDQGFWLYYKDVGDLRELNWGNKIHTSWELENHQTATFPISPFFFFFLGSHRLSLLLLPAYLSLSFHTHFLQRLIISAFPWLWLACDFGLL